MTEQIPDDPQASGATPEERPAVPEGGPTGRPLGPGIHPHAGSTDPGLQAPPGVDASTSALEDIEREGLEFKARTQWQLARRRFFRHKLAMASLVVLFLIFLAALLAPHLTPYKFDQINLNDIGVGPTLVGRHFFGTDQLGRDYFTRVLYGIRTSARVALLVAVLSTFIGTVVGALAGYYRGWVDNLLMRFVDLLLTLPGLAILLTASALLGQGSPYRVGIILALLFWTPLARVVRGTFLSLREKEFVEAARALGASDKRIMFRHMLPNSMGPIIVNATLVIAEAILIEAVLSFLGFGIQPPTPALGALIADGETSMQTFWWLVTFPGLTIVAICLCVNFIGDGLRDALDPTQRRLRA
ncbi:MAG: glutathione transport system permease protein [Actinomycetota bacterium]|nr:glutathione transport system permease protein [Actinomycetota bacterium]